MQSVTLLGPQRTYELGISGAEHYKFFEGIPVQVPDAIADRCRDIKGMKGRKIFRVEPVGPDPDADVAATLGVQLKFKAFGG